MSASLSPDDVRKVALLARLKLTDAEVEMFSAQLGQILQYVDLLSEVDTEEVEPLSHGRVSFNVYDNDEIRESLPREDALANAPKTDGKYFLVPPILDGA